nr:5-hydroxytryptamine receptor 3A [Misgurnus anguillicaudatus]
MVTSLLETIFITNILCNSSNYPPLPKWIRILVLEYLARLVCIKQKACNQNSEAYKSKVIIYTNGMTESSNNELLSPVNPREKCLEEIKKMSKDLLAIRQQVEEHLRSKDESHITNEWIMFGQVIDRLLFILYSIFITVSSITILVLWVNSSHKHEN